MQIWEPDELESPFEITESDSKGVRKPRVLRQTRRATGAVSIPVVNRIFISVKSQLFIKYVREKLGHIYGSYIAEITEEYGAVKLLGSDM